MEIQPFPSVFSVDGARQVRFKQSVPDPVVIQSGMLNAAFGATELVAIDFLGWQPYFKWDASKNRLDVFGPVLDFGVFDRVMERLGGASGYANDDGSKVCNMSW